MIGTYIQVRLKFPLKHCTDRFIGHGGSEGKPKTILNVRPGDEYRPRS